MLPISARPSRRSSVRRRRDATSPPLSTDGLLTEDGSPAHETRGQAVMSTTRVEKVLQTTSCRKALQYGPFPTDQEPRLSWCHACWDASERNANEDTMCTFKGTRFLETNGSVVWDIYTSHMHTGPAPELAFHGDWKPSEPDYNHKKILKVGASYHIAHYRLTLGQAALKTSLLPLVLAEIEHRKKVGDNKKNLVAVDRDIGVRDICGACLASRLSAFLSCNHRFM
jgi:hypothetical protein